MASLNTTVQDKAKKTSLEPPNKDQKRKLLFSEHQSDVVFKVGDTGELIHAHKSIITPASEVFSAQFNGDFAESKRDNLKNPVIIEDIQPATFKEVLRDIYCKDPKITVNNVMDILYAAEKYMLTGLNEKIKLFLKKSVNEDNVLLIFNKNRQYKFDFVDEICLKIIRDNPLPCFQSEYFLTLSQPALELIAACSMMNCQKEQLCEAIEEWRKFNNSTAVILPKWGRMQCQTLELIGKFAYGNTVRIMDLEDKMFFHGLGVFTGINLGGSRHSTTLLTVTIKPFNVSVSKKISSMRMLDNIEEFVFKRITITDGCSLTVTLEGEKSRFSFHAGDIWHDRCVCIQQNTDWNCLAYLLLDDWRV